MRVVSRGATVAAWFVLSSLAGLQPGCDQPKVEKKPPPQQPAGPQGPQGAQAGPQTPTSGGALEATKEPDKDPNRDPGTRAPDGPVGPKPPLPPIAAEAAPAASPRLSEDARLDPLKNKIESYYQGHASRRIHIQTDKPLYKPGETIWLKAWDVTTRGISGSHAGNGMHVELISPRGAQVLKRKVHEQNGMGQVDLVLAEGLSGGEYTLRVQTLDGVKTDRPVIVSSYEQPRLKMQLEFVRKAYGGGDEVTATIAVKRPTGEPLRDKVLSAVVQLDGQELPRLTLRTDANGDGLVRFVLPQEISIGDGLLTVLADDGGLTESVSKRVPILVKNLAFNIYPEGGDLVTGLPGRLYVEAKNPLGKPADVAGHIVDDTDQTVARFETVRDGLGRVDLTPQPGRRYFVEIDRPVGVTTRFPVPSPLVAGCTLRSFDDLDGQEGSTRVSVRCTEPRKLTVAATMREQLLDLASVEVKKDVPAVVYLSPRGQGSEVLGRAQGAARVTVFDENNTPLAERLIYRNRRARLDVKVTPSKKSFVPREQVQLDILTTDGKGSPVPADLALGVVDDTVLSFADDKTGHILSRLYLEPELQGKIEEPNFYFGPPIRKT